MTDIERAKIAAKMIREQYGNTLQKLALGADDEGVSDDSAEEDQKNCDNKED